jgi:hypothetical protein
MQLNERPIPAATFEAAVHQLRGTSPDARFFRLDSHRRWRYWGCRLYAEEAEAREHFG